MNPYSVTPRKPLTPKQRLQSFIDAGGKCCICGGKIDAVKERWIDEHEIPLSLDGTNDKSNRGPAHERCAKVKTAKEAGERAKGRSAAERHMGAKRSKMRNPRWKKKVNGQVVER